MTVLWKAGQQRVTRESRERLSELFVGFRDAGMDVLVRSGQAKPVGAWHQPGYITKATPPQPVRSPAARDATLAQLNLQYPGMVRRLDS